MTGCGSIMKDSLLWCGEMLWGALETGQEAVPEIPVREAGG